MIIIETLSFLRKKLRSYYQRGKRIALVPTMGNLHDGHMKLIEKAKANSDIVVVSIFLNPMQFDRVDDLDCYPRTFREDYKKLKRRFVDFLFLPRLEEIYPKGIEGITYVEVPGISSFLEGESRPGHFRGVSTIISKLFNLVKPNVACFGEKDFQQLALIRKMVVDLNYDIEIISVPTVRAKDGLALSSRNSYLTADQRKISPNLNKIMNEISRALQVQERTIEEILWCAEQTLNSSGFCTDTLQIRDADTLLELTETSKRAVILVAAWLGRVRLIDNKVVDWNSRCID